LHAEWPKLLTPIFWLVCVQNARKKKNLTFLKSMESQLSKAIFIFKIGQKLASVSIFEN